MQDGINEFEIRAPKFALVFSAVLACLFAVALVLVSVLFFVYGAIEILTFTVSAIICFIFLILSSLCLCVYFKEKIILKDEVITYYTPFIKAQSLAVKDIGSVYIDVKSHHNFYGVLINNKNGCKVIEIRFSVLSKREAVFIKFLKQRQIPVQYN